MTITIHSDLVQGSDEWLAARCGLLTASEVKLILTPTLKPAANDKQRAHLWELLAQRITRHVEPHYVSDDMLRGHEDEIEARLTYAQHFAPVSEVGFVTNDRWGFTLGCSPDGFVGDDGMIECKSRRQRLQVETVIRGAVPDEHALQCQAALMVTERAWLDYVSYSGGLPMCVVRVWPDPKTHEAILDAATAVEDWIAAQMRIWQSPPDGRRLIPTERRVVEEMVI
jgi:hypothetical protein